MSNYSNSKFNKQDDNTSWQKTFNLVPKKSLVLDIGCSSGTFGARLMRDKNCIVDGIEIDKDDFLAAKKVLRKVYDLNIETDSLDLPEKYDVVFMGDVIEHLARPIPTLKKVRNLLKPDGRLIFSVPNITHMSVRLMLLRGEIKYGRTGLLDETHLHFYSAEEVYRVLNAAGFEVEVFDYTVNDLPEGVIKEELQNLGLSMMPEFMKIVRSVNGAAYQFIGLAKPGLTKRQLLPEHSPLNIIDKYHKRLKKDYESSVAAVVADRDRVAKERDIAKSKLESILRRKDIQLTLKLAKPAGRIKNKITRIKNKNLKNRMD